MPSLDLHLLDTRYRDLRVTDSNRQARLVAGITAEGQRTPILVVPCEGGRFVVIDGYARIEALEALGRDTVDAVVLELGESEAWVLGHRLETSRRRTALEEGWLLCVLIEVHGKLDGYNVHANVALAAHDRTGLENLCARCCSLRHLWRIGRGDVADPPLVWALAPADRRTAWTAGAGVGP